MAALDPKKVRPRRDWISVLTEQRKKKVGSIILTEEETGVEKVDEGVGHIVRIGVSDHKAKALGLEPGLRIVFRGYIKHANKFEVIESEEKWEDGESKHYFMMSIEDIHLIIPEGLEVGVFSGRPQVPERVRGQTTLVAHYDEVMKP